MADDCSLLAGGGRPVRARERERRGSRSGQPFSVSASSRRPPWRPRARRAVGSRRPRPARRLRPWRPAAAPHPAHAPALARRPSSRQLWRDAPGLPARGAAWPSQPCAVAPAWPRSPPGRARPAGACAPYGERERVSMRVWAVEAGRAPTHAPPCFSPTPDEVAAVADLQAAAFYSSYPLGPLDALMYYTFRVRARVGAWGGVGQPARGVDSLPDAPLPPPRARSCQACSPR